MILAIYCIVQAQRIPLSKLIAYAVGVFGWSISINIISVMLLYLYLPPSNAGMANLVPQIAVFGLLNVIALVTSGGRLFDAVVDPMIAGFSDRSKHPKGRRIPFMAVAVIPMTLFAILIFYPPFHSENKLNLIWLAVTQLGYYFFFGLYVIPDNALIAEMGHYPGGKMQMSTAQSVGFIFGMVVSSGAPAIAGIIREMDPALGILKCNQLAIVGLNVFGAICMAVPVIMIDEKKYVEPGLATEPLITSLKAAWRNHNFRIFALADATYFMSIAVITSGLLYYVKAMLLLPESMGTILMALMVAVTLSVYPFVNLMEKKTSKKTMMVLTFFSMVFVFGSIYWLGLYPVPPIWQLVILMVTFGIPGAFLSVLPTAILAEIAVADTKATGQTKEGMYFGLRAFTQKFGQTLGILLFSTLTIYGKDPGHDYGLRLSGVAGAILCLFAGIVYTRYRED